MQIFNQFKNVMMITQFDIDTNPECHNRPHQACKNCFEVNQCLVGSPLKVVIEEVDNDLCYAVMHYSSDSDTRPECVGNARSLSGVLETIKNALGTIFFQKTFMESKLKEMKPNCKGSDW